MPGGQRDRVTLIWYVHQVWIRCLIHVGTSNLGLLMRQKLGAGTPRAYAGLAARVRTALGALLGRRIGVMRRVLTTIVHLPAKFCITPPFTLKSQAA